jgi:hypothetical protein
MNRFIKHQTTNTLHIYNPAWLAVDNHGFVECDAQGKLIQPAIEGEFEVEVEDLKAEVKKGVAAKAKKAPLGLQDAADAAINDAIDAALMADASKGL